MSALDTFTHRFEPATQPGLPPLLLLHGTGGDENDLLPLGRMVAPGAAFLSPRGAVLENGMPRFFRRIAEGVLDEADLWRRTVDLTDFVEAARTTYGLAAPIALGFSNGANIAAAMLMLRSNALAGAILVRPMSPFAEPPFAELPAKPILMLSGAADPIVTADDAGRLARTFEAAGAAVDHQTLPVGHGLSQLDVAIASRWLAALSVPQRDAA